MLSDSAARGSVACTGVALALLAVTMGLFGCGDTPAPPKKMAGLDTICIGPRAHTCDWKVDGDSAEKVENAIVIIQPEPTKDSHCASLIESSRLEHPLAGGDKFICLGANADDTCTHAKEDITLVKDHLDCPNCFAGLTMDLFYSLNVSMFLPQEISVGVKNAHMSGAAELKLKGDKSKYHGDVKLTDVKKSIKFPAGPIAFHIDFAFPTTLHYDVDVPQADFSAGYDLDVDFGDHTMTWTRGAKGFAYVAPVNPSVTVTPKLEGKVDQLADLKVNVDSNLALDVAGMVSFDIKAKTDVPLKVDLEGWVWKQVCISGQATANATHEEHVHFTLFGRDTKLYGNGPQDIFAVESPSVHKCIPVPTEDLAMVV